MIWTQTIIVWKAAFVRNTIDQNTVLQYEQELANAQNVPLPDEDEE